MNFEQLMTQGWKKEENPINLKRAPESEEKLQKIIKILKNWKVAFYTDRQALLEIVNVIKESNILEKIPFPPYVAAPEISSANLTKFKITFDGGTPCNIPAKGYGIGYGSYRINDYPVVRCNFGLPMSANCAEIHTLIAAIRNVLALETERHKCFLDIWGDSTIAVNWANGTNELGKPCKISKKSSQEFMDAVQTLRDILKGFGLVKAQWHGRANSVRAFGH